MEYFPSAYFREACDGCGIARWLHAADVTKRCPDMTTGRAMDWIEGSHFRASGIVLTPEQVKRQSSHWKERNQT